MDEKVVIEIELDDGTVKKGFATINREGKASGKKAGNSLEKGVKSGIQKGGKSGLAVLKTGLLGAALVAGTAFAGAFAAKKFIQAAGVQEDAVNSLNSSLIATGKFTKESSLGFQEYASSIQQSTRFGDEVILQNAALIQSLGNLDEDGLKKATQSAVDLSAALRIDLSTASNLVGRAAAGNVSAFTRYGVSIQKGATQAETFANTLTALNSKFGGAAARDVLTFSGTVEQLGNTAGDAAEDIGFLFTRTPELTAFTKAFEQSFNALRGIIADNSKEISAFIGGALQALRNGILITAGGVQLLFDKFSSSAEAGILGQSLSAITNFITNNFVPALGLIRNVFDVVVSSLQTGFQAILFGFVKAAQGVNTILSAVGIDTGFTENINNLAETTGSVLSDFSNKANEDLQNLFSPQKFQEQGSSFLETFNSFIEEAKVAATDDETGESVFAKLLKPFSEENIQATLGRVTSLKDGLTSNTQAIGKAVAKTAKQASFDLNTRLGGAIAGGVENITKSLLSGENVFGNFAKFALSTFGDLASQLGKFFIIQGFAVEALKGVSGAGAIAAGAGLIALGAILKSVGGGAGSALSGGAGGSIGSPSDTGIGVGTQALTEPDIEREAPGNVVNLNVQGDIFDSRDTSRRLSTLLTEAFDDEDITINQGAFA